MSPIFYQQKRPLLIHYSSCSYMNQLDTEPQLHRNSNYIVCLILWPIYFIKLSFKVVFIFERIYKKSKRAGSWPVELNGGTSNNAPIQTGSPGPEEVATLDTRLNFLPPLWMPMLPNSSEWWDWQPNSCRHHLVSLVQKKLPALLMTSFHLLLPRTTGSLGGIKV